ncbi:hypothetical protein [Microvirga arvi]|nr:hypothetical protein [Microvirga arvi]
MTEKASEHLSSADIEALLKNLLAQQDAIDEGAATASMPST